MSEPMIDVSTKVFTSSHICEMKLEPSSQIILKSVMKTEAKLRACHICDRRLGCWDKASCSSCMRKMCNECVMPDRVNDEMMCDRCFLILRSKMCKYRGYSKIRICKEKIGRLCTDVRICKTRCERCYVSRYKSYECEGCKAHCCYSCMRSDGWLERCIDRRFLCERCSSAKALLQPVDGTLALSLTPGCHQTH